MREVLGGFQGMTIWTRSLRWLFLVALSIYLGGFTFYSLVVIPILHDRLGSAFEAGLVTQRVTDALNLLGVATLLLGWSDCCLGALFESRWARARRGTICTLSISSICLVVLFVLHRELDRRLEAGALSEFYAYHRAYLWTSTVQWIANLALLIQSTGSAVPVPGSRR